MNKTWTVTVEEDEEGNTVLPLPKEMVDELGWLVDDILDMDIDGETVIIKNITCEERKKVV
jgi:hypothetical protein